MRFTIGLILCTAYILFLLSPPLAAESWIIQSINQEVNEEVSGGLQNSVQIAGASNDGVFIVQNIMQEAGVNLPDIRDMAITDRNGQVITESNTPEDINKFVDEIINRDDESVLASCKMEFPRIETRLHVTNESIVEELRTIYNRNFSEDIISRMDERYDFGDAPDQYHTLLVSNGARHFIVPGVYLGKKSDAEVDGQPNMNATGDDINEVEDEDGIIFTSAPKPGGNSLIDVTASSPGFLSAWMDFNLDGDWTDEGEKILSDLYLDVGINHVAFDVPAKALQGDAYSRFRFSSAKGLYFDGQAPDGEVEDRCIKIGED
jgi:hypothetical protein